MGEKHIEITIGTTCHTCHTCHEIHAGGSSSRRAEKWHTPGPNGPGLELSFFGDNRKQTFAERPRDVDVAKVNAIEGELDSFVKRRDEGRRRDEGERPAQEIWAVSCRHYIEARECQKQAALYLYHGAHIGRLDRTFGVLRAEHEVKRDWAAAKLLAYGVVAETLLEANPNGKDAA